MLCGSGMKVCVVTKKKKGVGDQLSDTGLSSKQVQQTGYSEPLFQMKKKNEHEILNY